MFFPILASTIWDT